MQRAVGSIEVPFLQNGVVVRQDHAAWRHLAAKWRIRGDTVYLNHGSFGLPPIAVQEALHRWRHRLDEQPVDFFVRQLPELLHSARGRLAKFLHTSADNLIFQENATEAMNVVARSIELESGDEILLTNHEYGAVKRVWDRECRRSGAVLRVAELPGFSTAPPSREQITESIVSQFSDRTRLLVVSHITSATAWIMPIKDLVEAASKRGILICIDGPHSPAQIPLNLDETGCDFYTASLHKWLSAPLGSGFLYAHPRVAERIRPNRLSWGVLPPRMPTAWRDEFEWMGTRDPSAFLTVPTAIEMMESVGLDAFRERTHSLACFAQKQIATVTGRPPMTSPTNFGSMVTCLLPQGDSDTLHTTLWNDHGIEVPVWEFCGERLIRVSCHLYTQEEHIRRLTEAIRQEL